MIDSSRKPHLSSFSPPEPRKPLTETQEDICERLVRGQIIKQIAADLEITPDGVYYHIEQIARAVRLEGDEELSDRDVILVWAYPRYRKRAG